MVTVPGRRGADIADSLKRAKIGCARTYPETMDQQQPAAGRFVTCSELSRSRAFVSRVLNLPLYYGMPAEQTKAVIAAASALFA